MTFNRHLSAFGGEAIVRYTAGDTLDAATRGVRLAYNYDGPTAIESLHALLETPNAESLEVLVIGAFSEDLYGEDGPARGVQGALVAQAARLPKLKGLFWGDITYEECEVSWIEGGPVDALLAAFPGLEHFGIRGNYDMGFANFRSETLRTLTVESGGLPSDVVKRLTQAELPQLEKLEIWLGSSNYGYDGDIDDLKPLLHGRAYPELGYPFPKLNYLGLRNAEIADTIADQLDGAMILNQVETLDLSKGTLSSSGVQALLAIEDWGKVKHLNISESWIGDEDLIDQLRARNLRVSSDGQRGGDGDWRYVSVGE